MLRKISWALLVLTTLSILLTYFILRQDPSPCGPCPVGYCVNNSTAGIPICRAYAQINENCYPSDSIRCAHGLTCGQRYATRICVEDCSLKNCADYCAVAANGTAQCRTFSKINESCFGDYILDIRCEAGLLCTRLNIDRNPICTEDCIAKNCSESCVTDSNGIAHCRPFAKINMECSPIYDSHALLYGALLRCGPGLTCDYFSRHRPRRCIEDCSLKNCSDYCVIAANGTAHCRKFAKISEYCDDRVRIPCEAGLVCDNFIGICTEDCSLKSCSEYCALTSNGTAICRTFARRNEPCHESAIDLRKRTLCADGLECYSRFWDDGFCREACSKKRCSDYCYNTKDGMARCGVYLTPGQSCSLSHYFSARRCPIDSNCINGVCVDQCNNRCNYEEQTCYSGNCMCSNNCPWNYSPVCGSDGKIYRNACELRYETCTSRGRGITVVPASNERCGLVSCGSGPPCKGYCITRSDTSYCRPYAREEDRCNLTLSPQDPRLCENGLECVRIGSLGSSGVCRKISPCNQNCSGYCETNQNGTQICKQYAKKGEICDFESRCHPSLACDSSGPIGSPQVCRERSYCSASSWARNLKKWKGYNANDSFDAVFNLTDPSIGTLGDAVRSPDEDAKHRLAREAVAALLNSANPLAYDYPYFQRSIIYIVHVTWNLDRYQLHTLADDFKKATDSGDCPF